MYVLNCSGRCNPSCNQTCDAQTYLVNVLGRLSNDALHVRVRPHCEAGLDLHCILLTWLAWGANSAAAWLNSEPVKPSSFPPAEICAMVYLGPQAKCLWCRLALWCCAGVLYRV